MAIDAGYFPGPRMFVTISALSQTGGHTDSHFMCGADLDIPLPDRPHWVVDGVEPMRLRVRARGLDLSACQEGPVMMSLVLGNDIAEASPELRSVAHARVYP